MSKTLQLKGMKEVEVSGWGVGLAGNHLIMSLNNGSIEDGFTAYGGRFKAVVVADGDLETVRENIEGAALSRHAWNPTTEKYVAKLR